MTAVIHTLADYRKKMPDPNDKNVGVILAYQVVKLASAMEADKTNSEASIRIKNAFRSVLGHVRTIRDNNPCQYTKYRVAISQLVNELETERKMEKEMSP